MKNFLALIAAVQGLATLAQSHGGCQIVPPHILHAIMNDQSFDQAIRDSANFTLQFSEANRQRRIAADGGEGIISTGDDDDYPQFQDPADAQDIQVEEQALETADQDDTPDPDSSEDDPDPDSTGDQRRRARRSRFRVARQGNGPDRYIYNKKMSCARGRPGTLVRTETSGNAVDDDINQVFDYFGAVYQLYSDVFGRDSIDGNGGKMHGQVHFCNAQYNNAEWDGAQMLFGDGDGIAYNIGSFVKAIDVIGHEMTHGVVQFANPLFYSDQTGALNEHLADIFGSLTKQYNEGTDSDSSDWLLGKGILTRRVTGPGSTGALRDLCNPGQAFSRDPQTAQMADYDDSSSTALLDHGGVHINSGIPNRAFCLFAKDIGGVAWDVPGQIWYNVLTQGQGQFGYTTETFQTFAQKTIDAATQLYGQSVVDSLTSAWQQVGVM